jgi:thiol peroxidase
MNERQGAVSFRGEPQTVRGDALNAGDRAPDFRLVDNDLSERTLADFAGRPLLISVVPSLETGICDAQTRRFDEEAVALGDRVGFITVSADLPFAQKRWCNEAAAEKGRC